MIIISESFIDGGRIPGFCAFAVPDPAHHVRLSDNRNPSLSWREAPLETRSFVLICHDPDVPGEGDDVNREGREVPSSLRRVDFFHWVLIDIPAGTTSIAESSYSNKVTPRGKSGPLTPLGARQGINDYTRWFAGDHDMEGDYYGYDGPCPPWNDALLHRYVFTLYALGCESLPVEGRFDGRDVRRVMDGLILAQAAITGTYTLNPRLA